MNNDMQKKLAEILVGIGELAAMMSDVDAPVVEEKPVKKTAKKTEPAKEAVEVEPAKEAVEETTTEVTKEMLMERATAWAKKDRDHLKACLEQVGAASLSKVADEDYAKFYQMMGE